MGGAGAIEPRFWPPPLHSLPFREIVAGQANKLLWKIQFSCMRIILIYPSMGPGLASHREQNTISIQDISVPLNLNAAKLQCKQERQNLQYSLYARKGVGLNATMITFVFFLGNLSLSYVRIFVWRRRIFLSPLDRSGVAHQVRERCNQQPAFKFHYALFSSPLSSALEPSWVRGAKGEEEKYGRM